MGNNVVKVAPDMDAYFVINNGYENRPMAWGNREEMVEHLYEIDDRKRERISEHDHSSPENRLARADERGDSSMIRGGAKWDEEHVGFYCGDGYRDMVRRSDLTEIYRRFDNLDDPNDEPDLSDLVLPYDEEE